MIVNFEDMVSGEYSPEMSGRLKKRLRAGKKRRRAERAEKKALRKQIKAKRKALKKLPRKKRRKLLKPLRRQLRKKRRSIRKARRRRITKGVLAMTPGARVMVAARARRKRKARQRALKKRQAAKKKEVTAPAAIPDIEPVVSPPAPPAAAFAPAPGYEEPVEMEPGEIEEEVVEPKKAGLGKMLLPLGAGLAALAFLLGE